MTEDPREFGLAAANRLYQPGDSRLPACDGSHGEAVTFGGSGTRLRSLADAIEAPALAPAYTDQAVAAVAAAAAAEHDLPGWLSLVLRRAAAQLGSLDALTAGRPGSWEAELVDRLARGLAGDDEGLAAYRAAP